MIKTSDLYQNVVPYLSCTDHTVSKEQFSVSRNKRFDMLVTHPVPESLDSYYESEEYISHTDGKSTWLDSLYQRARSITLRRKVKLLNSFASEEKLVLDIGAGTGDFLKQCKSSGWKVCGVEPNQKARSIAASKGIDLVQVLSELETEQFDVITLWHVLEHVPNLMEYIELLKKMLKPNGTLLIAVPNFKSYDAEKYQEFWAAFDVPRHVWHFSKTAIQKLFDPAGFEITQIVPMKFDAYYVSLLSEKYKGTKLQALSAFCIGWKSNFRARSTNEYSSLTYILRKN